MSSSALSTSIFVLLICVVSYGNCKAPNETDGTINWNDEDDFKETNVGSDLKTKYDAKGLQPWYNFANSFISTVLNKDPFDLVRKAKAGTLTNNLKDDIILGYALGMIIVVGIGLLFCLIMPIVGFCFCCCRCCGNCGGEMSQKDNPNNNCKRAVFGVILLIITLLMFTGVLLTFVCNDRMSDTVDGMVDTSSSILNEAIFFINRTVNEAEKLLSVDFNFVVGLLSNDLSDNSVTALVGDKLLKELDKVSVEPIQAVKNLSQETQRMKNLLQTIRGNQGNLSQLAEELDSGLNDTRNNLTDIQTQCNATMALAAGGFCNNISPGDLATEANFTNLPNISSELQKIESVVDQDFEKSAQEGLKEVTNIPGKVINKTQGTRNEILRMISKASDTVHKYRNDFRKIADNDVVAALKKFRDKTAPDVKKEAEKYDKYRWIAGVCLTCILLLIVVLMALGLMCGVCGHDKDATPTTRGTVSNMGGLSLMAATAFCFIFASLLMLLTTICFIIGAPAQTICKSIQSGALYKEVIDNPSFWGSSGNPLSKAMLRDSNIEFSIGGFIDNCRQNKPLFKAAPFDQAFNVTKKLDIKELLGNNTTQEFDNLNVNFDDVNILSNKTRNSLIDLGNSGVDEIDFEAFLNETRKGITAVNLQTLASNFSDLAAKFQNAAAGLNGSDQTKAYELGNKSEYTAQGLRDLHANTVVVMEGQSAALERNVNALRSIGANLKVTANTTLEKAEKAETHLHTQSAADMKRIVTNYTDRVLGWGHQFTGHVLDVVNNKLAKCQPVTNIYDAAIVVVCNQALYPFNGFWFSIGYCLFFFIPAIIFCVKLAKHYRRMDYESEFDQGMDAEMYEMGHPTAAPPAYGNDKKMWTNQKNSVFPEPPPVRS